MTNQLTAETGYLTRLLFRQDRIRIPVWLLSLSLLTWATAWSYMGLYESGEERQAIAETMRNPAMIAMAGPGYGFENYTIGALTAHQNLLFTAVLAAIMSILLTVRHTRAEEEDGRIEMVRSLPVGRLSSLSAVVAVLTATNLGLAALVGFGLYALRIESMNLEGSLLYGAALGAAGFFFAALTAFFAQLSESARGTTGLSLAVLGTAYVLRAVGDVSNNTLSWFSPLGWILETQTYVNNYWWPILLTLSAGAVLILCAFYLNARRDLDAGLLPTRPGRLTASPFLQGPFGLAWRLQRTSIIAWAAGMFLIGLSYGSVLGDLETFFGNVEALENMLQSAEGISMTEQFISLLMVVMSMIGTVPVLLTVLKLKGEEKKARVDHVLGRSVSRTRQMGSYLLLAVIVSVIMQVLSALGLWSAGNAMMEEPLALTAILGAALAYLPAILVMAGAAILLLGLWPALTGVSYLILGYSFLVVYLGELLQFPDWMGKLSPFDYTSRLPVEEMNWLIFSLLLATSVLFSAAGFRGYRNRDIQG